MLGTHSTERLSIQKQTLLTEQKCSSIRRSSCMCVRYQRACRRGPRQTNMWERSVVAQIPKNNQPREFTDSAGAKPSLTVIFRFSSHLEAHLDRARNVQSVKTFLKFAGHFASFSVDANWCHTRAANAEQHLCERQTEDSMFD